MGRINIRYIVSDVEAAIAFYRDRLGFQLDMHPAPGFASLSRDGVSLLLNRPGAGGAGKSVADQPPAPGGWNRFQVVVDDIEALVAELQAADCRFRSGIIVGNGGSQALVEDPSGNLVELFQPR